MSKWLAMTGLIGIIGLSAIFRTELAHYSLWLDEFASVFFASQPLSRLWSIWLIRETNPPLYYSLLHVWIALFGLSDVGLRVPSILASLCIILVVYTGTARHYGRLPALIAAAMLALSGQQLLLAHQVRSYIFVVLAIAISVFGLLQALEDDSSDMRGPPAAWFAYVGGAVAAIYLHTTAIVWPAAASLSLLIMDPRYRPFRGPVFSRLVIADLAIAIGATWWLYITYLQIRGDHGNISWITWPGLTQTVHLFFTNTLLMRDGGAAPILIALFAVIGAFRTRRQVPTRFAAACFVTACCLFMLISYFQPIVTDRTICWLSIFPLVLAAVGLASIRHRQGFALAAAAVLGVLGFNLLRVVPKLTTDNWTVAVDTLVGDRNSILFVDGEAMSLSANLACQIELKRAACPFLIVTIKASDRNFDPWAVGHGVRMAPSPIGQPILPTGGHAYLVQRPMHDIVGDFQSVGLLRTVRPRYGFLHGPYPPSMIDGVNKIARIQDGLVSLNPDRHMVRDP